MILGCKDIYSKFMCQIISDIKAVIFDINVSSTEGVS